MIRLFQVCMAMSAAVLGTLAALSALALNIASYWRVSLAGIPLSLPNWWPLWVLCVLAAVGGIAGSQLASPAPEPTLPLGPQKDRKGPKLPRWADTLLVVFIVFGVANFIV